EIATASITAAQNVDYLGNGIKIVEGLASGVADKFREWAKALGAGGDEKNGSGFASSSVNRLADILQKAEEEIDAQKQRTEAGGMTAQAADENEKRQDLLNRVTKAGIPLMDGLRNAIDKLSKAFAEAKIAADVAEAIQSMNENI